MMKRIAHIYRWLNLLDKMAAAYPDPHHWSFSTVDGQRSGQKMWNYHTELNRHNPLLSWADTQIPSLRASCGPLHAPNMVLLVNNRRVTEEAENGRVIERAVFFQHHANTGTHPNYRKTDIYFPSNEHAWIRCGIKYIKPHERSRRTSCHGHGWCCHNRKTNCKCAMGWAYWHARPG